MVDAKPSFVRMRELAISADLGSSSNYSNELLDVYLCQNTPYTSK